MIDVEFDQTSFVDSDNTRSCPRTLLIGIVIGEDDGFLEETIVHRH